MSAPNGSFELLRVVIKGAWLRVTCNSAVEGTHEKLTPVHAVAGKASGEKVDSVGLSTRRRRRGISGAPYGYRTYVSHACQLGPGRNSIAARLRVASGMSFQ
jgi:hypothetical protein